MKKKMGLKRNDFKELFIKFDAIFQVIENDILTLTDLFVRNTTEKEIEIKILKMFLIGTAFSGFLGDFINHIQKSDISNDDKFLINQLIGEFSGYSLVKKEHVDG